MSNRGIIAGTKRGAWNDYVPELRGFASAATPTQPSLGNATRYGRWLRKPSGLVVAQGMITFGSTTTFGSSENVWGVSLPYPANRSSGGADLPIGQAWAYQQGRTPSINMILTPTLMDPFLGGGGWQSNEDYWCQFFNPYIIDYGTGTITSGNTSVTITHNLANWTPNAYDIHVVPTANTSNNPGIVYVDTITSTGFNVNVKANPGASNLAFAWKIRGEPNASVTLDLLVNHQRPWVWQSGDMLSWNITYEGRR